MAPRRLKLTMERRESKAFTGWRWFLHLDEGDGKLMPYASGWADNIAQAHAQYGPYMSGVMWEIHHEEQAA